MNSISNEQIKGIYQAWNTVFANSKLFTDDYLFGGRYHKPENITFDKTYISTPNYN